VTREKQDVQQVHAADRAAWRAWLEANHASHRGIALVFYKKGSGKACVSYDEAVEEALCFGWIDSRKNALDEERYTFLFTPRKAGSGWAKTNRTRIERLIASGRMSQAGLTKVEEAKRDGSWTALDALENPTMPDALRKGLAGSAPARRHFDSLSASQRKLLLRCDPCRCRARPAA
jgi:uncharacterized protein YdeI (YjbR/CyaY-like superfamily)